MEDIDPDVLLAAVIEAPAENLPGDDADVIELRSERPTDEPDYRSKGIDPLSEGEGSIRGHPRDWDAAGTWPTLEATRLPGDDGDVIPLRRDEARDSEQASADSDDD